MNEKRIEFISVKFHKPILRSFKPDNDFILEEGDELLLCMSWPWRAPDKNDFNSVLPISTKGAIIKQGPWSNSSTPPDEQYATHSLMDRKKISIPQSQQLRIRTVAHGKSTVRFCLIYADISADDSFIGNILEGIGAAIIRKSTEGISRLILKEGMKAAANYNLESIVESASGEPPAKHILGRGSLDFSDQINGTRIISIENNYEMQIAELEIRIASYRIR